MGSREQARDEAVRAAGLAAEAAAAASRAAGAAADVAGDRAAELAAEAVERTREIVDRLPVPAVLEGTLEQSWDRAGASLGSVVDRGGEAWDVLRGRRRRRWPWATGAAVAGAAAGVGAALLLRALRHEDPPGAQEPEEVQAVVDTGGASTGLGTGLGTGSATPAAPVPVERLDEDGEAVQP